MDQNKKQFRSATLNREAVDMTERTVELSFSSETPYMRSFGLEILGHNPNEVDLSRLNDGAPFLVGHNPDEQVGVILNARIDPDKVGRATVKISRSEKGQEILQDIADGIRTKISVGYIVERFDETSFNGEKAYRATRWQPLEISSVSIPADNTVGVARSEDSEMPVAEAQPAPAEIVAEAEPEAPAEAAPSEEPAAPAVEEAKEEPAVEVKAVAAPVVPVTKSDAKPVIEIKETKETTRVREEIIALANRFKGRIKNIEQLKNDALKNGNSLDQFKEKLKMETQEITSATLGMTNAEVKNYSLHNLIMAQMPGSKVDAAYEREISNEIAKKLGRAPQGFYVPADILRRDQQSGSATHGQALVGTNTTGFIDYLYDKLLSAKLGVQFLPGLTGNVSIPKRTGTSTVSWVTEGNAATESSSSFGNITLAPKTLTGFVDFSRTLMLQSTPAIENLVREDLAKMIAIGIDKAVLYGTGASGQPTGVVSASGVQSASMANFGMLSASVAEAAVLGTNFDSSNMKFVTTPAIYSALKVRAQQSGYPVYVLQDGKINGYAVEHSAIVPASTMIFGDFSNVIVGQWGGLDVLVDPYTASSNGNVRISVFASVDVGHRYASSMFLGTSVS